MVTNEDPKVSDVNYLFQRREELGFNDKLPSHLIQDVVVSGSIDKGEKVGFLLVSKSLLVLRFKVAK
jgi:hypothetical protein